MDVDSDSVPSHYQRQVPAILQSDSSAQYSRPQDMQMQMDLDPVSHYHHTQIAPTADPYPRHNIPQDVEYPSHLPHVVGNWTSGLQEHPGLEDDGLDYDGDDDSDSENSDMLEPERDALLNERLYAVSQR